MPVKVKVIQEGKEYYSVNSKGEVVPSQNGQTTITFADGSKYVLHNGKPAIITNSSIEYIEKE